MNPELLMASDASPAPVAARRARRWSALWRWYFAIVAAVVFLATTGLVPAWGVWYSESMPYRQQTEALLHGSLSLANSPMALRNDLAWHNGGVQQVWGLAVPAWRLPFEILA